jgi:hypothetical protein
MTRFIEWVRGFGMPEWLLVIMLSLVALIIPLSIIGHQQFMAECLQDHKQYECTAMWRSTQTSPPLVIITR